MELLKQVTELYRLEGYDFAAVPGHEGGRNGIFVCRKDGENRYILRVSGLGDRTEGDHIRDTEESITRCPRKGSMDIDSPPVFYVRKRHTSK